MAQHKKAFFSAFVLALLLLIAAYHASAYNSANGFGSIAANQSAFGSAHAVGSNHTYTEDTTIPTSGTSYPNGTRAAINVSGTNLLLGPMGYVNGIYTANSNSINSAGPFTPPSICEDTCTGTSASCPSGQRCVIDTSHICCNSYCTEKGTIGYCKAITTASSTTTTTITTSTSSSSISTTSTSSTSTSVSTSTSLSTTSTTSIPPAPPPPSSFPINPKTFFPLAGLFVLVIIMVAALVYALASVINSQNAKNWAKIQVYEALLSILMLVIFSAFVYVFFLNPQGLYSSTGMLPLTCRAKTDGTLFNLSNCDLSTFTNLAYAGFTMLTLGTYVTALLPGFSVNFGYNGVGFSASLVSILPKGTEGMLSMMFSALLFFLVLNQVQLILVSGSLLWLSLFVTIGLVMRTLGFTRSFGGTLIALGLGLGLVYPMLVSVTYGFLDSSIINAPFHIGIASIGCFSTALISTFTSSFTSNTPLSLTSSLVSSTHCGVATVSSILTVFGYLIAGLTFVPFLNFIILDAFIVDFSKAIGERIDFMSLLSNFI